MIVQISGGASGIKEYLEKGQKRDRGFSRDEADKRVTLHGDLDVTNSIIQNLDFKENYHHITLSFKEDYVSQEELQKATDEFIQFMKAAYKNDEINIYAEAHLPKIKSYRAKNGELVIRKPHIHIVVPNVNLTNGLYMEPFGKVTNNIHYIDSFQELYNQNNGFESPKDNMSNEISPESSIVSRHKGDLFTMNKAEKEEILSYIVDNNITSYAEFEAYLKTQGTLKTRNAGKDNEYLNIKYPHESKGINLKEFCFSKKFIEEYTHEDRIDFLIDKAEEKFFEKKEAYSAKTTKKQEKLLKEWFDVKSKEIKYINYKSKFYKETYKNATYEQKIELLTQKAAEFYEKYDLEKEIEQELRGYSPMATPENEQIEQSHLIEQSPMATSSFVNSKIKDFQEKKELENIVFKSELIKDVYSKLSQQKGVLASKYGIDDEGIFLNNSSKKRVDLKEFMTEQMNFVSSEIHLLQNSILAIENANYIKYDKKGQIMSIQVNIKTNEKDKNQVDYLQVGSVDRVGKFTGFVYDQADIEHKSSATLFMINDKVVDYEEFKKLPNFQEMDDKMKLIVESSKETHYSKELRMNYVKENLTLTEAGKTYANSKHNFKDMQPIAIGMSKFENERKVDQNIWTRAKQFVLEHWHQAKDKIEILLTSRYDLAASNIALAVELQQMKAKLEDLRTYQEAIKKQAELIKEHQQAEQAKQAEAEEQKNPKREFSFGELFDKLDRAGNLRDKVKFAQELESDPEFTKMKSNALELIKNLKEGKVELTKDEVRELALNQAQAANMMAVKDIPVKTIENVKSFIDVLKSIKDMSFEKGLDFEHLLNQTLGKMADKLQTPEQKAAKAKEQEDGIER